MVVWLKFSDREIFFDRAQPNDIQFERPAVGQGYYNHDGTGFLTAHCCQKFRPWGVYFTDDGPDNWPAWCISRQHRLSELTHKHKFVLDERKILFIRNADELREFSWEYTVIDPSLPERYASPFSCPAWSGEQRDSAPAICPGMFIDWSRISRSYDGFIVTPYQDMADLAPINSWYNHWPWGVGCVWNKKAILAIRLLEIDPDIVHRRPDPDHHFKTPPSMALAPT